MSYTTDGLTFNTLRSSNLARMTKYRNSKGKLTHSEGSSKWSPAQWLQAVVGELGEYANFRKKYERGDVDLDVFKKEAAKELADVIIYLDILADQLDIDLGQAIMEKFNETSKKMGVDITIDAKVYIARGT